MPEAILLQDVEGVGERGSVVDVSKGYLRNFLIPRKLAQPATKGAVAAAQARMEAAERALREATERAQESATVLARTVLTIPQQAGEDGRLFGSVTAQDVVDFLQRSQISVERRRVHLDEPIKTLGESTVTVRVHPEVTAQLRVNVVRSEGG